MQRYISNILIKSIFFKLFIVLNLITIVKTNKYSQCHKFIKSYVNVILVVLNQKIYNFSSLFEMYYL